MRSWSHRLPRPAPCRRLLRPLSGVPPRARSPHPPTPRPVHPTTAPSSSATTPTPDSVPPPRRGPMIPTASPRIPALSAQPSASHAPDVPGATSASEAAARRDSHSTHRPRTSARRSRRRSSRRSPTAGRHASIVMTSLPAPRGRACRPSECRPSGPQIDQSLDRPRASLAGTGSTLVSPARRDPVGDVRGRHRPGLDALLANPDVASVVTRRHVHSRRSTLSTAVIDSDLLNSAGVLGDNFDGSAGVLRGRHHRLRRRQPAQHAPSSAGSSATRRASRPAPTARTA